MTVISYKPCCLASIVMFASIVSLQRFQFEAAWVLWRRVGWLKQTLCLSVVNTNASHSPLNISRLCSPAQEAIDVAGIMHHPRLKRELLIMAHKRCRSFTEFLGRILGKASLPSVVHCTRMNPVLVDLSALTLNDIIYGESEGSSSD